jgi:hypothetical protein
MARRYRPTLLPRCYCAPRTDVSDAGEKPRSEVGQSSDWQVQGSAPVYGPCGAGVRGRTFPRTSCSPGTSGQDRRWRAGPRSCGHARRSEQGARHARCSRSIGTCWTSLPVKVLPGVGELASLSLVIGLEQQSLLGEPVQHGGLGKPVPAMAGHRPHLPVPPRRVLPNHRPDHLAMTVSGRGRPRPLRRMTRLGPGLPTSIRPFRDADQLGEPSGRHPRVLAEHLEVRQGPNRPSALFFHTRN